MKVEVETEPPVSHFPPFLRTSSVILAGMEKISHAVEESIYDLRLEEYLFLEVEKPMLPQLLFV